MMRLSVAIVRGALGAALLIWPAIRLKADDWPQWRGPERNGISREKGLASEWSASGPKQLWLSKDAASGYGAPIVSGDNIYLIGNEGLEKESLRCLSVKDGTLQWSVELGKVGNPNQKPNFPAARSTPTLDAGMLYVLSSDGDLVCVDAQSRKEVWRHQVRADFGGMPGEWAYAESPLIDGRALIVTPGGPDATMVALDKKSGATLWKCAVPGGDAAAYASAMPMTVAGTRQYVTFVAKGVIGVEASTGKFLWRYDKSVSRYGANIPTPMVYKEYVYASAAGTGGGLFHVIETNGAFQVETVYLNPKLPTAIGGAVKVGDQLYGTTPQNLVCLDFMTGKVLWQEPALGAASICEADGRLYLHGENGDVALVVASPKGYEQKGRFTPVDQPKHKQEMEKAWAYPVIANGRLYIRDQDRLWCYDVRKGSR